jgi:hypothetical protein
MNVPPKVELLVAHFLLLVCWWHYFVCYACYYACFEFMFLDYFVCFDILDGLLAFLAYVGWFHLVVVVFICLITSILLLWLFGNNASKTLP